MKRFSEFLRIIVFFWRSRLSIDAKIKEKDGEKIECAHTRWRVRKDALLDLSVGVRYFRFVGGGGGGRVSPTSWSFYRLLCRRLYEQLLKPLWSYEGLYWTQWTLWNSRRWPVSWREANNVNCRFNPPPPTYKSAQLWAHLPVNKTCKLPGDFETPPDITLLPCSDYNWVPFWIQFIMTFKWSLIKNQSLQNVFDYHFYSLFRSTFYIPVTCPS